MIPDPGPGEAVVKIQACGVCHTDQHYKQGRINDEFPFLLKTVSQGRPALPSSIPWSDPRAVPMGSGMTLISSMSNTSGEPASGSQSSGKHPLRQFPVALQDFSRSSSEGVRDRHREGANTLPFRPFVTSHV